MNRKYALYTQTQRNNNNRDTPPRQGDTERWLQCQQIRPLKDQHYAAIYVKPALHFWTDKTSHATPIHILPFECSNPMCKPLKQRNKRRSHLPHQSISISILPMPMRVLFVIVLMLILLCSLHTTPNLRLTMPNARRDRMRMLVMRFWTCVHRDGDSGVEIGTCGPVCVVSPNFDIVCREFSDLIPTTNNHRKIYDQRTDKTEERRRKGVQTWSSSMPSVSASSSARRCSPGMKLIVFAMRTVMTNVYAQTAQT